MEVFWSRLWWDSLVPNLEVGWKGDIAIFNAKEFAVDVCEKRFNFFHGLVGLVMM
jgi:hypothetical protein